jgi:predicted PurR-regulated permease PerM
MIVLISLNHSSDQENNMPQNIIIQITAKSIVLLLAAALVVWTIINFSSILLILFIAILLAVAITPLVERLEKLRMPRWAAIVLIYLALLGIVAIAIGVLVPVLIDQVGQLSTNLPAVIQSALDIPGRWAAPYFPAGDLARQLSDQVGAIVGSVGGLLVGLGKTLTTLILNALLVLVVGFFLTSDPQLVPRVIERFFPPQHRARALALAREIGRRLGHWVRAQLLVCLFYGICFGIGLELIGVPYAFALGLAAAIMELIPYVGGAIVTGIAMLIALSVSPWLALGVLVLYLVVANVEANIVYPKVVGDIVGVHPLVIIIALFIGAEARGVMGALLAVPFAVVLQVLFDKFYRFEETPAELPEAVPASVTPEAEAPAPQGPTPTVTREA